jgi:hypothetical protein
LLPDKRARLTEFPINLTKISAAMRRLGFAQKVFHCIRTASGSDRPNTQLLERNLILKLIGV